MEFITTKLSGVVLIKPDIHGDERGFFIESYKKSVFMSNGIRDEFVQDNHSRSSYGVLRGLHYQLLPRAQSKLVRCVKGRVFDVAVDIRVGSPTFGEWFGCELSEENKQMLYIPSGFAHGFLTLSEVAELLYKTSDEYSVAHDRGVLYNDPQIGIIWPDVSVDLTLSEKDKNQPLLENIETNFTFTAQPTQG
jgi:dTDP-4-dehydrorhamnose 3,5-epimerase